jgi:hypothetical protein
MMCLNKYLETKVNLTIEWMNHMKY